MSNKRRVVALFRLWAWDTKESDWEYYGRSRNEQEIINKANSLPMETKILVTYVERYR